MGIATIVTTRPKSTRTHIGADGRNMTLKRKRVLCREKRTLTAKERTERNDILLSCITDYSGKLIEDRAKTARKLIDMLKEEGYEPTELEIKFFDGSHPIWNEKPEKKGQE